MVDTPIPGEWQFINTLTAPPASGQTRLNNLSQTAATRLWISKTPATGGDVSALLAGVKQGQELSITNKADANKWQVYAVSGSPVDNAGYTEFPVAWRRGNGTIPEQRLYLAIVSTNVTVAVTAPPPMQALVGSVMVVANQSVNVAVTAPPPMQGVVGSVDASGQLLTRDFAFPFQGMYYTSPGMTLRQWYASQAMSGFISNAPAANLIGGNLAAYCFKVADSMIKHEEREKRGARLLTVSTLSPPNAAPPTQSAPSSVPMKDALALQKSQAVPINGKGKRQRHLTAL